MKEGDRVGLKPNWPNRFGYHIGTATFTWVTIKIISGRLVRVIGRPSYGRREKEFVVSVDDIIEK